MIRLKGAKLMYVVVLAVRWVKVLRSVAISAAHLYIV